MTQTSNRFLDEMARLMNDAAGVATGVRREFDTMVRNQADRILRDLDVVKREEFEAVKEMARLAREENEDLKARLAALEARLGPGGTRLSAIEPSVLFRAGSARSAFLVFRHSARYKRAEPAGRSYAACSTTAVQHQTPWRHAAERWAAFGGRFVSRGFCTMATVKEMKAAARSRAGKGAARAERRAGRVPGVIYGDGKPPLNVSVDHAELKQRIYAGHFLTTMYELDVDGAKHRVIPRDFQLDPVKDLPVHVDFLRLERRRADPRAHSGPRHERRPGAGREARRHRQYRHPHGRGGVRGRGHPGSIDVDISGLEINYSEASERGRRCRRACAWSASSIRRWSPSCRRRATRKK